MKTTQGIVLTRGQAFLFAKSGELDAQTKIDMENGNLRFVDGDIYLRKSITGKSGIQVLLDETNIKKVGTTNFDQNKFPKGFNLVLEKIRFAYATSAVESVSKNTYSNKLSSADKALQNAELRIKQDGKTIVNLPVARLMAEAVSTSVQGKEDCYNLDSLQLLKENSPISIEIEYPNGDTVDATAATYHNIEIRLMGTATAPR